MSHLRQCLEEIQDYFGRPFQVEFDYSDRSGLHHGRCYVQAFCTSKHQVIQYLKYLGYQNVKVILR